MSNVDEITDLEAFHNSYHYYIQAVEALALDPADVCERYGNYNVAAELKLDCGEAGIYLINNPACTFTQPQREAVASLARHIQSLPRDATLFADLKPESLVRLQHPAWIPVRAEARELLKTLQSATEATAQYFGSNGQSAA